METSRIPAERRSSIEALIPSPPLPSPKRGRFSCMCTSAELPRGPVSTALKIDAVLQKQKCWLCLRGLKNHVENCSYEIDQICDNKEGFLDRSLSPGGYILPFHPVGLLVALRESEISLFIDKRTQTLIPFIGTHQVSGLKSRRYESYSPEGESPKKYPVIPKTTLAPRPEFFSSFQDFYRSKPRSPSLTPIEWLDHALGGDEFVATLKPSIIVGIYITKIDPEQTLPAQMAQAIRLQALWLAKQGEKLPIYDYKITEFHRLP